MSLQVTVSAQDQRDMTACVCAGSFTQALIGVFTDVS